MSNKRYLVQCMNASIENGTWDNEKNEVTLERAINYAERLIEMDAALPLPYSYRYRVIDRATGEAVWYS